MRVTKAKQVHLSGVLHYGALSKIIMDQHLWTQRHALACFSAT
ncbi:hypothetical protein ALT785_460012 [Alteromonas infernus]